MRLLQQQDIPIAAELSAQAGWNQTPGDWGLLLRLNPESCFGIDSGGRLVSTATLACYGTQLGWIGMVLTHPRYRRRGFARTLLGRAIEKADQLGIESLKLDATDQGQPLYESLGFRVEQPVERWSIGATQLKTDPPWDKPPACPAASPGPKTGHQFSGAGYDFEAYSADRSRTLQLLAERGAIRAEADGFCLFRPGQRANYIGPCMAGSAQVARRLIEPFIHSESYWDILPENKAAHALAIDLGFTPQRKLTRMVRGRDLRGKEDWIYAIAGFELG